MARGLSTTHLQFELRSCKFKAPALSHQAWPSPMKDQFSFKLSYFPIRSEFCEWILTLGKWWHIPGPLLLFDLQNEEINIYLWRGPYGLNGTLWRMCSVSYEALYKCKLLLLCGEATSYGNNNLIEWALIELIPWARRDQNKRNIFIHLWASRY